jgi:hypothetical protein
MSGQGWRRRNCSCRESLTRAHPHIHPELRFDKSGQGVAIKEMGSQPTPYQNILYTQIDMTLSKVSGGVFMPLSHLPSWLKP